jgi:dUTP pyrophosphatase
MKSSLLELVDMIEEMSDEEFNENKENFTEIIKSFQNNQSLINETKKNLMVSGYSIETIANDREGILNSIKELGERIINKDKRELMETIYSFLANILNEIIDDKMRTSFLVPIELCHPDAKIPTYAHEGDAGVDLYLIEDVEIAPKATVIAKTGLKMAIPMGYELQIRPRSGTSLKTALRIANAPGTIDSTYRDEIGILAWNTSDELLTFKKGDRIAQGVLNEVPMMKFTQVDDITKIVGNRNGGYGSSGQ